MSQKGLQRWQIMGLAKVGKITLKEAGEKMGVSYRQAKRIRGRVQIEGACALVHGNRGRRAHNRIEDELCKRVLELSRNTYHEFNDTHFTELLAQNEGITLSRETVRKLRRAEGIAPKQKRRGRKHRKRRERKEHEGLMLLWDGSHHRWFGPELPACCLLLAMDDSTGKVLAARFFPFEGSQGYLWVLKHVVQNYGIPISVYQDRHSSLHRNDDSWSLEEQLAGKREPTQVGLALEALGVQPIFALSPQARGRIERLFRTLQDRLVAELQRAGIKTMESANRFLHQNFIKSFNKRFAVKALCHEKAWRKVPKSLDLDRLLSFRYKATVGNDNTVRIGKLLIDIPPGPKGQSYAKSKVEVRQLLDGSWRIYSGDTLIAKRTSTTLCEPMRAMMKKKHHAKGADSYCWVYVDSAQKRNGEILVHG